MPRKKILFDAFKLSLDITASNKVVIDSIKDNYGLKYGPTINMIIRTFCSMDKNVKERMEQFCLDEYERLSQKIATSEDSFNKLQYQSEQKTYYEILKLINGGRYNLYPHKQKEEVKMKRIEINNGHVVFPEDWIILNEKAAKNTRYALVVECKHSSQYGIPHFLYFSDVPANEVDNALHEYICTLCRQKWERFAEIEMLEKEKPVLEAPTIGIFGIFDKGTFEKESDYPCGAMVVRY